MFSPIMNARLHILEALSHIGSAESLPFLVGILEEPFQVLRVAAAACIIQCINQMKKIHGSAIIFTKDECRWMADLRLPWQ